MAQILDSKLTTKELASELKRSPETLLRWRRQRIGPPYLRVQGRVLYDRNQVEAWLASQQVGGSEPQAGAQ
ncbi:MAG: helix-turn-helix domain-containing protein [Lysobacter sp.]